MISNDVLHSNFLDIYSRKLIHSSQNHQGREKNRLRMSKYPIHLQDVSIIRTATLRWFTSIRSICQSDHREDIVDVAVYIFDSFISRYFSEGANNEYKTKMFFGLAGAACILLSSKLNDQKSDLCFESFPYYPQEMLTNMERLILNTLDHTIDTLDTPLFKIRRLLTHLPKQIDENHLNKIMERVVDVLDMYYLDNVQNTLFSGFTVGLSALLVVYNLLEFNQNDTKYLFDALPTEHCSINDLELCLKCMSPSHVPKIKGEKSDFDKLLHQKVSPVSVAKLGK